MGRHVIFMAAAGEVKVHKNKRCHEVYEALAWQPRNKSNKAGHLHYDLAGSRINANC